MAAVGTVRAVGTVWAMRATGGIVRRNVKRVVGNVTTQRVVGEMQGISMEMERIMRVMHMKRVVYV